MTLSRVFSFITVQAPLKSLFLFLVFYAFVVPVYAQVSSETEAKLKAELTQNEQEQAKLSETISLLQNQSASLDRDIKLLNAQINAAQLKIKAKNLQISELGKSIQNKTETIQQLTDKTEQSKQALAELIRRSSVVERYSLPEVILSGKSVSEFFNDVYIFSTFNSSLTSLVNDIRETQAKTEVEKQDLSKRRDAEIDARYEIQTEQDNIKKKQTEVASLLALTKKAKANYSQVLAQRAARAAQIRSALFNLRDSQGIPFATALEYANLASAKTGIRPAFLLAVLTQETNLGKNVGTCNRPGDPDSKKWRAIMPGPGDKSSRDDETAYLKITSTLGLDPDNQPLSCPWQGGWGGAMGPSQFIPTTWLTYSARVSADIGGAFPNPWSPRDAFIASALYLTDLGAANGGYTAERNAALKYYAGGNWKKPANAFYGNQVMAKAQTIQDNIDTLKNN